MIRDMKDAGLDITLEMNCGVSELSYRLFSPTNRQHVPLNGLLHIGASTRLLAVQTSQEDVSTLKIGLSRFDVRLDGTDKKILNDTRIVDDICADVFDLKSDPDALVKLQNKIIASCALQDIITDNDEDRAFGARKPLRKPRPGHAEMTRSILTPGQISAEFNTRKNIFSTYNATTGLNDVLQDLSRAIDALKNAKIDVSLEMSPAVSEQAFSMFVPFGANLMCALGGILKVGSAHYMVCLATERDKKPVLQIALSKHDIRYNGSNTTANDGTTRDNAVRADIFDLKNDPEALIKFQQAVIEQAARTKLAARE